MLHILTTNIALDLLKLRLNNQTSHFFKGLNMNRRSLLALGAGNCILGSATQAFSKDLSETAPGIVLPMAFVQPFELQFLHDDIHIIAWIQGHSEYEAIEAMIRRRPGADPIIRCIITRHNQTQVDHINDRATVEALLGSTVPRETKYTNISLGDFSSNGLPGFKLSFTSYRGETIEFRAQAASRPESTRGGLTDPGTHSIATSLPIMLRGKSALLSDRSEVVIEGHKQLIPVKISAPPHFVGLNGAYTEDFRMGIIRAGTRDMNLLEAPSSIKVGAVWAYQTRSRADLSYQVTERLDDDQFRVVMLDAVRREEMVIRPADGGLALLCVRCFAEGKSQDAFSLNFLQIKAFELGIGEQTRLLSGIVVCKERDTGGVDLELSPAEPSWAQQRSPKLSLRQHGRSIEISTSLQKPPLQK
jgi:hypothetical protein